MFNRNTCRETQEEIRILFDAQVISNYEKYLGMPMVGEKSKVSTFKELQERVTKKVVGWKEKNISKAGRDVLIKTVPKPSLHTP